MAADRTSGTRPADGYCMLAPTTSEPPRALPTSGRHDDVFFAILNAPLQPGETVMHGYARKEQELRHAFAALPVLDARELYDRLSACRPGDLLAARFAGMVVERRSRLLAFLAGARRRAAVTSQACGR